MKFNIALPTSEWVSVFKGALVAGAGVALTYLVQNIGSMDLGVYGPVVAGVLAVVSNIIRKSVSGSDTPAA